MSQTDYDPCDVCNMSCNICEFGRVKERMYNMESVIKSAISVLSKFGLRNYDPDLIQEAVTILKKGSS